jgi:hypothetical protein
MFSKENGSLEMDRGIIIEKTFESADYYQEARLYGEMLQKSEKRKLLNAIRILLQTFICDYRQNDKGLLHIARFA